MLLLFLIGFVAATNPVNNPEPASAPVQGSKAYSYAYAVDFSVPAPPTTFSCLRSSNYRTVFVRVYDPRGAGQFDTASISNIRQAASARLGVEVYMTPQMRSRKNGSMQFNEILYGLNGAGINLKKIWIQVTSPKNWDPYPQNNVYFLNQIIMTAQRYGIGLGFYTNYYDWTQITNNAWASNSQLWYWNVLGGGPRGETPANFDDYRAFGNWLTPTVKQFAQVEGVCGITVNRDVYPLNGMKDAVAVNGEIGKGPVVGVTFGSTVFKGLLQNN